MGRSAPRKRPARPRNDRPARAAQSPARNHLNYGRPTPRQIGPNWDLGGELKTIIKASSNEKGHGARRNRDSCYSSYYRDYRGIERGGGGGGARRKRGVYFIIIRPLDSEVSIVAVTYRFLTSQYTPLLPLPLPPT